MDIHVKSLFTSVAAMDWKVVESDYINQPLSHTDSTTVQAQQRAVWK